MSLKGIFWILWLHGQEQINALFLICTKTPQRGMHLILIHWLETVACVVVNHAKYPRVILNYKPDWSTTSDSMCCEMCRGSGIIIISVRVFNAVFDCQFRKQTFKLILVIAFLWMPQSNRSHQLLWYTAANKMSLCHLNESPTVISHVMGSLCEI